MAISAITLNSVDEQIKLLGVAPQILPRLQQLLSDGNTNPDDIMDLIKLDTALASRVIRTSNSAYFSRGFEVTTIEDAVTYLGYDEVYRIMMILAFSRIMRGPLPSYGLEAEDLWRRSLACALAMEGLAKTSGYDRRKAYTIGLLHGIGMVFVEHELQKMPEYRVKKGTAEEDVRLLGVNHAEIGAYVMRKWDFPEELVEPVRNQFTPLDCTSFGKQACLLSTARCIIRTVVERRPEDVAPPSPDPLVMTMIGLGEEDYEEVLEETEGKFTLLEVATVDF